VRRYPSGTKIAMKGKKLDEMFFICEGRVDVYGVNTLKKFLTYPQNSYIGDYQILFDLVLCLDFKTFNGAPEHENKRQDRPKKCCSQEEKKVVLSDMERNCFLMCLRA
jgi:hypothetical protein